MIGKPFRPALLTVPCCLLLALDSPLAHPQAGTPGRFVAWTAAGKEVAGSLHALAEDWSVTLDGKPRRQVDGTQLIELQQEKAPLPAPPDADAVILSNGDRLRLAADAPLRIDGERLLFRPRLLRPVGAKFVAVPLAYVVALKLAVPGHAADLSLQPRKLLAERRPRDLVRLANGDLIEGTIEALDRAGVCRIRTGKRTVEIPFARVAAVVFSSDFLSPLRGRKTYGQVVLADGSRLGFASLVLKPGSEELQGKTLFRARVAVPIPDLLSIDLRLGRAVYLSDLKPASYEHAPFFSLSWPLARDTNVAGGALRLAGSTYDKGLGMHSGSRVTYRLDGKYRRFEALAGLDGITGRRGRVRLQVLLDGKPQPISREGEITGGQKPISIRLPVHGARELTLVVDYGRFGPVQGRVNWAKARLIR